MSEFKIRSGVHFTLYTAQAFLSQETKHEIHTAVWTIFIEDSRMIIEPEFTKSNDQVCIPTKENIIAKLNTR